MPISCPLRFQPLSDADFAAIDRSVMGCCYASQNALGRLCDERVYESDVAARLHAQGTNDVQTELPVTVTHEDFAKTYRLDLVVGGMVYEFKTVAAFAPEHETQAIHYAALTGAERVKLVNFRSVRVEGQLLRSPLWRVDRSRFEVGKSRWRPLCDSCVALLTRMTALLGDWGAFLAVDLYEDALVHFFGGETQCLRRLPVVRNGLPLGTHRIACHALDVGFLVTALTHDSSAHESQLVRLLHCLPLRGLQWFNLNHTRLELVTLSNGTRTEAKE
ncbi:MAG TPA: GxxExxY protein [Verrucomicrobiae bacterium]